MKPGRWTKYSPGLIIVGTKHEGFIPLKSGALLVKIGDLDVHPVLVSASRDEGLYAEFVY